MKPERHQRPDPALPAQVAALQAQMDDVLAAERQRAEDAEQELEALREQATLSALLTGTSVTPSGTNAAHLRAIVDALAIERSLVVMGERERMAAAKRVAASFGARSIEAPGHT